MLVQGHHCLLIKLKLCNVVTCIGGKTGGWEKTGVAVPAGPSLHAEQGSGRRQYR